MKIECSICKKEINRKPSNVNIVNNFCSKECHKKHLENITNSPNIILNKIIKSMWTNMNIRCGKYRHLRTESKCKSYDNISITFSMGEFKDFCYLNKERILSLNRPSLDRIDSSKDYSIGNIDFIELSENIRKKKAGSKFITNSFGIRRGVKKVSNKYVVYIKYNRKVTYVGSFVNEEDAYDAFRQKYFELWNKYPW